MVRVKRGNVARKKRKKILKRAKGFRGSLRKLFRASKQAVYHAMAYATADRRTRKGDFRRLWNVRIGAAAKKEGSSYSRMMGALKKANILINRKMLAELAVTDHEAFKKILETAQGKK
ncbi:MAG: 50S ribosomal protein L20 [Candidatus Margulisiibacteriota bacterium]